MGCIQLRESGFSLDTNEIYTQTQGPPPISTRRITADLMISADNAALSTVHGQQSKRDVTLDTLDTPPHTLIDTRGNHLLIAHVLDRSRAARPPSLDTTMVSSRLFLLDGFGSLVPAPSSITNGSYCLCSQHQHQPYPWSTLQACHQLCRTRA
jgi:hypothetical protein